MSRAQALSAPALPRLGRAALLALVLAAVGIFHVWARTRVLSAGYALGELQKEHVKLTSDHDRLRIEVETLRSPEALERFARTRLGMAPPAPGAVQAAGLPLASAGGGGKGVPGVVRPGPAEPSRSQAASLTRAAPGARPRASARRGANAAPEARGPRSEPPLLVATRSPARR
jgi:cell division protein FtsL